MIVDSVLLIVGGTLKQKRLRDLGLRFRVCFRANCWWIVSCSIRGWESPWYLGVSSDEIRISYLACSYRCIPVSTYLSPDSQRGSFAKHRYVRDKTCAFNRGHSNNPGTFKIISAHGRY
jgi:hypothetical protein